MSATFLNIETGLNAQKQERTEEYMKKPIWRWDGLFTLRTDNNYMDNKNHGLATKDWEGEKR